MSGPQGLAEDDPEMLGERPEIDPFEDDTPIECEIDQYEVCESCQ